MLGCKAARLTCLAVVGTLTLGLSGAALVAATPASADPTFQFVEVGSDVTELLMDAFANIVGGGVLAEYDSMNPLTQVAGETITPQIAGPNPSSYTSCSYTRPNGSGGGVKALVYSLTGGATALGQEGTPPQPGCITLSRSSSAPGSVSGAVGTAGSLLATGNLVYIPFAIDALTYATGPTTSISTTTLCVASTSGCAGVTNGFGQITFATTPATISQTADFSVAQLQTLYATCLPVTVGGIMYNPGSDLAFSSTAASPAVFTLAAGSTSTAGQQVTLSGSGVPGGFTAGIPYFVVNPSGSTFELAATSGGTPITGTSAGSGIVTFVGNIDLYAPLPGTDPLAFWELLMGVTAPQPCWHQTIIAGPAAGVPVEQNDGSALASDPNGIVPFSISRWVAMSTGVVPDVRHGAILQSVTTSGSTPVAVPPLNSSGTMNVAGCLTGTSFNQATCFPITRELYNVADYYEVVNTPPPTGAIGNPPFNSTLAGLFAGPNSQLCGQTFLIQEYGFGTNLPDQCGATTPGLRVQMNNTASEG